MVASRFCSANNFKDLNIVAARRPEKREQSCFFTGDSGGDKRRRATIACLESELFARQSLAHHQIGFSVQDVRVQMYSAL